MLEARIIAARKMRGSHIRQLATNGDDRLSGNISLKPLVRKGFRDGAGSGNRTRTSEETGF